MAPDENVVTVREFRDGLDGLKGWLEEKFEGVRTTATCDERHRSIDSELAFYRKLLFWVITTGATAIAALAGTIARMKGII